MSVSSLTACWKMLKRLASTRQMTSKVIGDKGAFSGSSCKAFHAPLSQLVVFYQASDESGRIESRGDGAFIDSRFRRYFR